MLAKSTMTSGLNWDHESGPVVILSNGLPTCPAQFHPFNMVLEFFCRSLHDSPRMNANRAGSLGSGLVQSPRPTIAGTCRRFPNLPFAHTKAKLQNEKAKVNTSQDRICLLFSLSPAGSTDVVDDNASNGDNKICPNWRDTDLRKKLL